MFTPVCGRVVCPLAHSFVIRLTYLRFCACRRMHQTTAADDGGHALVRCIVATEVENVELRREGGSRVELRCV